MNENIYDAEVSIPRYFIFRSDKTGRVRGGSGAYLRSDLGCISYYSFCNSVVEILLVKCKKLDALIRVIYRPPNTSISDWKQATDGLSEAINLALAHGDYKNLIIGGDFNLPRLTWNNGIVTLSTDLKSQEEMFVQFMSERFLTNIVTEPTRENRTLDLLLTNVPEWFGKVRVTKNVKFSDHNTISMDLLVNITDPGGQKDDEDMRITSVIVIGVR